MHLKNKKGVHLYKEIRIQQKSGCSWRGIWRDDGHPFSGQKSQSLLNGFSFLLIMHFLWHIDFIQIARIPLFTSGKHLVYSSEEHPSDGNNGSLFTSSFHKALVLSLVVRSGCGFYGSMGTLYQCWFEVDSGTCDPNRFLLTGRLVVARRQARPAAQAPGRVKTILRLRAHGITYLCLKGGTYTD